MAEEIADVEGWAVVEDGKIDVRTVSPARRAAIVNWLVTSARCPIFMHQDDAEIDELFEQRQGDAFVARVAIACDLLKQKGPF